jgi:Tfp pilus assembly protein PilN
VRAVNLLPPDLRGASSNATGELAAGPEIKGGAGSLVVLAVLAACVAGTAAYVLTNNAIEQRKSDLAVVTARQQAVQRQAAKLRPYADFDAMTKARTETVRDIAGRRFAWDEALRDLSRAIPADVTLSSLSGDLGPGSGSISTPSGSGSLRSALDAPAFTLQGCARDQRSVARLMARLRNVDGVTRVSLSKSVKAAASAAAGAGVTSSGPPCGDGTPPSFELVMFFERASASVAGPGGASAASGTTPAPAATATPAAGSTPTPTPGTTTASSASITSQGGATP